MTRVLLDELLKCKVKVMQAPKMHLRLVEFVLEIETLLYVLQLDQSRNDFGLGKLLSPHYISHVFDLVSRYFDALFEYVHV